MQAKAQELTAARREGLITDFTQLKPTIPLAQNAAPLYRDALALYKRQSEAQRGMEALGDAMRAAATPAQRSAAAAILARQKPLITLVEKAVQKPGYWVNRDWNKTYALEVPEPMALRYFARLFCVRALLASDSDKPLVAFDDLDRALQVGKHLGQDATLLIGALSHFGVVAMVHTALVRVLERHSLKPDVLARARKLHEQIGGPLSLTVAMRTELPMGLTVLEQVRRGKVEDSQLAAMATVLKNNPKLADQWVAQLTHYWRETYAELRKGSPRTLRTRLSDVLRHYRNGQQENIPVLLLVPYIPGAASPWMRVHGLRALREGLLSVLTEAQANNGAFPDNPRLPVDPYAPDSAPVRYQKTAAGFVLYCVGENGKDDGGSTEQEKYTDPEGLEGTRERDQVLRFGK